MKDFKVIYRDREDRTTLFCVLVCAVENQLAAFETSESYMKTNLPCFETWSHGPINVVEISRDSMFWN